MEATHLLLMIGAAVCGAVVGVLGCQWRTAPTIAALRERIERAEQARNGALERSATAREQIAQLNRAIAALRRAHGNRPTAAASAVETREQREARAEVALRATADATSAHPHAGAPQVFPDTQSMER